VTKVTIETLTAIELTVWGAVAMTPLVIGLWKVFHEWRASRIVPVRMFAAKLRESDDYLPDAA
jgi:hypothetical protein